MNFRGEICIYTVARRVLRGAALKDDVMFKRPPSVFLILCLLLLTESFCACNKMNPPKNPIEEERKKVVENKGRFIMNLADPANMTLAKVEGVCLIEGLADTGSDEPPSTYQEMVLEDLQRDPEKKKEARSKLASMATAIGMVSAVVPPGARKGDHVDVEVNLIPGSTATSIEGGYINNGRLYQFLLADYIRKGAVDGLVAGRITLDPELLERSDPIAMKKGTIIGGAVIVRDRPIWLTIRPEERSVGVAKRIEDVINSRFCAKINGVKRNVAEAKYGAARINLIVPDEYRDNINRYVNVILQIAFFETPDELNLRMAELRSKLADPGSSEEASYQLEAIGPNNPLAVDIVAEGLDSPEESVRYNAAMTMAYMNVPEHRSKTAQILGELAETNKLYRPSCLAVLGTCLKSSFEADQVLHRMLSSKSAETRYGAFRALWTRNPADYMIEGESLGGQFSYHCLNCDGSPMIHVTKSKRAEIVLFSKDRLFLSGRFDVDAGERIVVRSVENGVEVKRYSVELDESRVVGYDLDSVIRAIVDVGGNYPTVVRFLIEAKRADILKAVSEESGNQQSFASAPLMFDALPGSGGSPFRRVRDVTAVEREIASAAEARKREEKKSFWSKANPVGWFTKEEQDENYTEMFSDEEGTQDTFEDQGSE